MAQVPSNFRLKTEQSRDRNYFPLAHRHLTTTDFFKMQPVVARKVEPNDTIDIDVTSFVRMFPMPFPVFGRIKYYNRCFFVPFRQIQEGFNEFINDMDASTGQGFVHCNSAPWFTNCSLASAFTSSVSPTITTPLIAEVPVGYYWRSIDDYDFIVDNNGKMVIYTGTSLANMTIVRTPDGMRICRAGDSIYSRGYDAFGYTANGTYTITTPEDDDFRDANISDSVKSESYVFEYNLNGDGPRYYGGFTSADEPTPESNYDDIKYDFIFNPLTGNPVKYRFTNRGRHFYTVLCSLGYRVDFSSSAGAFTNTRKRSAARLLAYLKVFLDWYTPSAYSETNALRQLFRGIHTVGKELTYNNLMDIAFGLDFVTYDRDYFTSAWQTPTAPNASRPSNVAIEDFTVTNYPGHTPTNARTIVQNYQQTNQIVGSDNGTPVARGIQYRSEGTVNGHNPYPENLSYYAIESLRALTNYVRRYQLAGNRAVDRYLSKYGVKLDDDRLNRCYYIGGYSYDADIMDIMSTADTDKAALGDYAGKGIAYSDRRKSFHFESGQEHGIIIVVSSVVPEIGYVQGISRENLQLSRLEFFNGDFDNLGTQPQLNEELFADVGMPAPNGEEFTSVVSPDGVRGYVPRYMEEKIGEDYLTGDFNVPSRREGMDAFHLFRLFNTSNILPINKDFLIGEQTQYDRIFNNTDDDYDHMYVEHFVMMKFWRNMKSAQDVYDFEHSEGKTEEVAANGTQLN